MLQASQRLSSLLFGLIIYHLIARSICLQSEWRRQQSGFQRNNIRVKEPSTLHSINFFRVVLDEAHFIKDRSSNTARSVFNLKCTFKWSLSGTPLQNRVVSLACYIIFNLFQPPPVLL